MQLGFCGNASLEFVVGREGGCVLDGEDAGVGNGDHLLPDAAAAAQSDVCSDMSGEPDSVAGCLGFAC